MAPEIRPSRPPDDSEVLVAAQLGCASARDALYGQFHGLIISLARRVCSGGGYAPVTIADDAAGETYRMLLDPEIQRYEPTRGTVIQYIAGLVRNATKITLRRLGLIGFGPTDAVGSRKFTPADPADQPARDDGLRIVEDADAAEVVLARANETIRFALVQKHWLDRPVAVTADQLGMTRFTLARRTRAYRNSALSLVGATPAA